MESSRSASCRVRPVNSHRTGDRRISSSLPPRRSSKISYLGWRGQRCANRDHRAVPPIAVGEPVMLTFVDSDAQWTVRGAWLASIVSNTVYEGMRLPAAVVATVLRGRATARTGEVR